MSIRSSVYGWLTAKATKNDATVSQKQGRNPYFGPTITHTLWKRALILTSLLSSMGRLPFALPLAFVRFETQTICQERAGKPTTL
jgi:hypothetical protein